MSPVTSKKKQKQAQIFETGFVDCDVMGLPFENSFVFTENEITRTIDDLHEKLNQGHLVQEEIDRYWLVLMMVYTQSSLLAQLPWQAFVLRHQDVFVQAHLPDIGQYIRMLTTKETHSHVMCRMIQYSLPYIKHNRLTFAKYDDVPDVVLIQLMQILLAMCLGLHHRSCKKPVWRLRFRIIAYMYTLMSTGSSYDWYLFCINNLNLIRIAIVEYFVYYVKQHMPCEFEMLRHLFGVHTNVENICAQFQININHFRSTHMQTDKLHWGILNEKAHVIIEKCNRICKGKPRMSQRRPKGAETMVKFQDETVKEALQMPVFDHIFYMRYHRPALSLTTLRGIQCIQDSIKWHALPSNLVSQQCQNLQIALYKDTQIYSHCVQLHQCLSCCAVTGNGNLQGQFRTDSNQIVSCSGCKSSTSVVSINMVGRVVTIFDTKYYLCPFCLDIHVWTGTGSEFTTCAREVVKPAIKPRQCTLCSRVHNLHEFTVLDDTLGIHQHISLCARHMPWSHQQHGIYNFETLIKAIECKLKHTHYI